MPVNCLPHKRSQLFTKEVLEDGVKIPAIKQQRTHPYKTFLIITYITYQSLKQLETIYVGLLRTLEQVYSAENIRKSANIEMAQRLMKATTNMVEAIPRLATKAGTTSMGRFS